MQIVTKEPVLLTNYEVYAFLNESKKAKQDRPRSKGYKLEGLCTVEFECLDYLESSASKNQTAEHISVFLTKLKPFALTRAEKVQIINTRPCNIVTLHVVIEECEERFNQEQLEQILEIIAECLPPLEAA